MANPVDQVSELHFCKNDLFKNKRSSSAHCISSKAFQVRSPSIGSLHRLHGSTRYCNYSTKRERQSDMNLIIRDLRRNRLQNPNILQVSLFHCLNALASHRTNLPSGIHFQITTQANRQASKKDQRFVTGSHIKLYFKVPGKGLSTAQSSPTLSPVR